MSATRKLRKLLTLSRSDGVSSKTSGLSGVGPPAGIENDPGIGQFDVARIFRLDHFDTKNADIEVPRFFLVPDGEEMRCEEAFLCNRRVG